MSIFFTKDLRAVWLKNIFPKVDMVTIIERVWIHAVRQNLLSHLLHKITLHFNIVMEILIFCQKTK